MTKTKKKKWKKPRLTQFPTPIGEKVIVKRVEAPDMTAGGVALPSQYSDAMNPDRKTINCTVLAVGPGKRIKDGTERTPMTVEVGDEAIVDLFAVTDLLHDRQNLFVVDEKDILAVIR